MKSRLFPGGIILVAGFLLALVPFVLFPVCTESVALPSGKSLPMRCLYTGHVESALGVLLALLGFLLCFYTNRAVRFGICLAGFCLSLLILAVPTLLIGVCLNTTMPCHIGTYPAVMVLGGFTALVFLILCIRYGRGLANNEH